MKKHYQVQEVKTKSSAKIDGRLWSIVNVRTHGKQLHCANCGRRLVTGLGCYTPLRPTKEEMDALFICRECVGSPREPYTLTPLAPSHYSVFVSDIRIGTVEKLGYNRWQAISSRDAMPEGHRTREDAIDYLRSKWIKRNKSK